MGNDPLYKELIGLTLRRTGGRSREHRNPCAQAFGGGLTVGLTRGRAAGAVLGICPGCPAAEGARNRGKAAP